MAASSENEARASPEKETKMRRQRKKRPVVRRVRGYKVTIGNVLMREDDALQYRLYIVNDLENKCSSIRATLCPVPDPSDLTILIKKGKWHYERASRDLHLIVKRLHGFQSASGDDSGVSVSEHSSKKTTSKKHGSKFK